MTTMRWSIPCLFNKYFPALIVITLWVPLLFYSRNSQIEFEVIYPTYYRQQIVTLVPPLPREKNGKNGPNELQKSRNTTQKAKIPSKFQRLWWKNRIQDFCNRLNLDTDPELFVNRRRSPVFVHEKLKLAFCPISEVGTRYSEDIFSIINDNFNARGLRQLQPRDIIVSNSRDFEDEDEEYFKFVFVSDPLTRLVFAFMRKFESRDPAFARLGRRIARTYRKNSWNRGHVNFQEFVEYLIDPKRQIPIFEHWQPYYELCGVCRLTYDFVGKLETVEEDVRHILSVNDLKEFVQLSRINSSAKTHSFQDAGSSLTAYYSTVPKLSLVKLLRMYYYDYLMFNITVPAEIEKIIRHKKLS